jgi:hypothetical protein
MISMLEIEHFPAPDSAIQNMLTRDGLAMVEAKQELWRAAQAEEQA